MKLTYLLLAGTLLLGALRGQAQTPAHRSPSTPALLPGPGPVPVGGPRRPVSPLSPAVFDSARAVSELNQAGVADAYPWLSPDGLRLYYTIWANNSGQLHVAARPNLTAPFGPPVSVSGPFTTGTFCAWLSDDERDVWYVENGALVHATRPTAAGTFAPAVAVTLLNLPANAGGPYGPSLSTAGDELFLGFGTGSATGGNALLRFTRTAPDTFTWVETLTMPTGILIGAAHLTDHDRQLIISAGVGTAVPAHLVEQRRATPTSAFGPPRDVIVPSAAQGLSESHSHYRANLDQLVYVSFLVGNWLDSDLWIASYSRGLLGTADAAVARVGGFRLAPNPAASSVRLIGAPAGLVIVFDGLGRVVRTATAAGGTAETGVSVEGLPAGLYVVRAGGQARRLVVE